jgi:hypothetical protein
VSGQYGRRDETCPVSMEGGTRRVHLVREGGGGLRGGDFDREPQRLLAVLDDLGLVHGLQRIVAAAPLKDQEMVALHRAPRGEPPFRALQGMRQLHKSAEEKGPRRRQKLDARQRSARTPTGAAQRSRRSGRTDTP